MNMEGEDHLCKENELYRLNSLDSSASVAYSSPSRPVSETERQCAGISCEHNRDDVEHEGTCKQSFQDVSTCMGSHSSKGFLSCSNGITVYIFVFVNPLSGGRQGQDLLALPTQHFRLKRYPHAQVAIYNLLDNEERLQGLRAIANLQKCRPIDPTGNRPSGIQLCVWSAGGDGTVMSVHDLLVEHNICIDTVLFSCIPLGTGNDIAQYLGWGKSLPHRSVYGKHLEHLDALITDRLTEGSLSKLDVWQVEMTVHPNSGYVEHVQHTSSRFPVLKRKLCCYMSLGVQGYVGSGFEKRRTRHRWLNMFVYVIESAKWLLWRRFPPITSFVSGITVSGEQVLSVPQRDDSAQTCNEDKSNTSSPNLLPNDKNFFSTSLLTKQPIDMVIQNIPHIWGRGIDLWGDAVSGLESVLHRQGPTDAQQWTAQRADDGRIEVMVIHSIYSYLKKLANIRNHVSRIGQLASPFEITFRRPQTRVGTNWERDNIFAVMCDGEFYLLKDPHIIRLHRASQIWVLRRDVEDSLSS